MTIIQNVFDSIIPKKRAPKLVSVDIPFRKGTKPKVVRQMTGGYSWQKDCFETLRNKKHWLINVVTGAGKSTVIQYLLANELNTKKVKKALIIVPQLDIGYSFIPITEQIILKYPDKTKLDWWRFYNNMNMFFSAKMSGKKSKFEEWLTSPADDSDRLAVCSHQMLSLMHDEMGDDLFEHFKDTRIVIDEAHHLQSEDSDEDVLGNKLGKIIANIHKHTNARIGFSTATNMRGDRLAILNDNLKKELVHFRRDFYQILEAVEYYEGFSFAYAMYDKQYTEGIYELFRQDNLKKTIIHLPYVTSQSGKTFGNKIRALQKVIDAICGRKNVSFVYDENDLIKVKTKEGNELRIVDLAVCTKLKRELSSGELGCYETRRNKLRKFIKENPTGFDVIICQQLFKEGSDWEQAERSIIVDARNSLTEMLQLIGRVLRMPPGKTRSWVYTVVPAPTVKDDETQESMRVYYNNILLGLLLQEVYGTMQFRPRKYNKKTKKDELVYPFRLVDIVGEDNVVSIDAQIFQALANKTFKCDDYDKPIPEVVEIIKNILDENGIEYSQEELESVAFNRWRDEREKHLESKGLLPTRELDLNTVGAYDLPFDSIADEVMYGYVPVVYGKDAGKLTLSDIMALLGNGKEAAIKKAHEICQWIVNENDGKMPKYNSSKKSLEKIYHSKIVTWKLAKNDSSHGYWWYPDVEIIFNSYGYVDIFNTRDLKHLAEEQSHECAKWIILNGRAPKSKSTDKTERYWGMWLSRKSKAKVIKMKGAHCYYGVEDEIFKLYGLIGYFEIETNEQKQLKKIEQIISFIKENNRLPIQTKVEEKSMHSFIQKLKQAYHNSSKRTGCIYCIYSNTIDKLKKEKMLNILDKTRTRYTGRYASKNAHLKYFRSNAKSSLDLRTYHKEYPKPDNILDIPTFCKKYNMTLFEIFDNRPGEYKNLPYNVIFDFCVSRGLSGKNLYNGCPDKSKNWPKSSYCLTKNNPNFFKEVRAAIAANKSTKLKKAA